MIEIAKSAVENMLANVSQDRQFWCRDGRVLRNLSELETAFREMSDETFRYHSNSDKNDFSNWIKDVIGDEKLGRDLQGNVARTQATKRVANRIAWLKRKLVTA